MRRLRVSRDDHYKILANWWNITYMTHEDEYRFYLDGLADYRMDNPGDILDDTLRGYLWELRDAEESLTKLSLLQEALDV